MIVLKQDDKYLAVHKETGSYELTPSFNTNVKTFDNVCDAIKFALKMKPQFTLKVKTEK